MKILTKVLYRSLWEDVLKILMKSCQRCLHDLVQVNLVILYRSLCEDLVMILPASSKRSLAWSCTRPYEKMLWRCWRCPSLRCPSLGSCTILCKKPLHKDLADAMYWCLYESSCGRLSRVIAGFLYQDLVGISPAADDFVRFCPGPGIP